MSDKELMQQALDALNNYVGVVKSELNEHSWDTKIVDAGKPAREAIEAIKARLAQHEPPCKTGSQCVSGKCTQCEAQFEREWVGLTDKEMFKTWLTVPAETEDRFAFARAIEQALKEKNNG